MRILYGVAGEGMGHATRSRVVIEHLTQARGHSVLILSSRGAYKLLSGAFNSVHARCVEVSALTLRAVDGAVDVGGSLRANLAALPAMTAACGRAFMAADAFQPDVVVTDFEPVAGAYAPARGLPIVSVDNIQMLARCHHDTAALRMDASAIDRATATSLGRLPPCARYVITTFFYPSIRARDAEVTVLVPPLIRDSVCRARAHWDTRSAGHVLVYQTMSNAALDWNALAASPRTQFVVYGAALGTGTQVPPNCTLRAFDESGFVADLAGARAVVSNGGMSLLGEALLLGKPVLAVPLARHPEQQLNAAYLALLGYGATAPALTAGVMREFLAACPVFAGRLATAPVHTDTPNVRALAAVDSALAGAYASGRAV